MMIENTPRPPAATLLRASHFATLFSEGIEEAPPPAKPVRAGGLARAASALVAQSLRMLLAPIGAPAVPRPALARVQVRARSAT